MKIRKNHIHLLVLLFAVSSLLVHSPPEAFAAAGDVDSTVEINDTTTNGPTLADDDWFGYSVANIGDLNGDGVNDLAVGAKEDDEGGDDRGAIHIMFMNTDGSVDSTVEINSSTTNGPTLADDDWFGYSVANIGDLNGDGVNDLAVGAPLDDAGGTNRGAVHIMFMNTDGSVDSTVEINDATTNGPTLANTDYFGYSVANIGDLNGDGVNDIAVGAPLDNEGGSDRGAVHIMFMNTDGSVDSTVEINDATTNGPTLANIDYFGASIANIGDLDGDGVNDLAVGAKLANDGLWQSKRGTVHIVFMNTDGSVDSTVKIGYSTTNGPTLVNSSHFGTSIANIGDLDGDGVNDLAVGASKGGSDKRVGIVFIMFMNTNGSVDSTVEIDRDTTNGPTISDCCSGDYFGYSVANIGDLDGDGVTDLAVGAPLDDAGGDDRGALHIIFLLDTAAATIATSGGSSDDLINPKPYLTDEILVSVGPNKAIVTDTDYLPNIQIQKGDSITITLNVADKGPKSETNTFYGQSDIESVSLYTNFGSKPTAMNLYYANHFNSDGEVSKTFYEWNANRDNVVYDFTKSVEWHNPVVRTAQFDTSTDNSSTPAEDKLTITFYSTWNEIMPKSEIIVKAVDSKMGYSTTTLPFTLQVGEYNQSYEDLFGSSTNYRFVPLVSDIKVRESIEQWVDPFSGMTDERFVSSLGLQETELPGYVKYLAQWVIEDKIDLADLIIAVEYIINVK